MNHRKTQDHLYNINKDKGGRALMENTESNKRRENRVPDHHIVRVRPIPPSPKDKWDACIIKNASKTGILFYSSVYYEPGSRVEIKISNPILPEDIACHAVVARCFALAEMEAMYGVALEFMDMCLSDKEAFEKTIELFLKKKKK